MLLDQIPQPSTASQFILIQLHILEFDLDVSSLRVRSNIVHENQVDFTHRKIENFDHTVTNYIPAFSRSRVLLPAFFFTMIYTSRLGKVVKTIIFCWVLQETYNFKTSKLRFYCK